MPLANRSTSPRKPAAAPAATAEAGRVKAGKGTLVEFAYREIRRRILDNEYPPGHQVLEFDLAAELKMSRTPVREALVRLQNENFVHLVRRHGMRVVPLSLSDLRDIYDALAALELRAVERVARSRPPAATMAPIHETLDQMERALRRNDLASWAKADERFHRTLVVMCGNARLVAMVDNLWDQGHRARMTTLRMRKSLERSNQEHRAVAEAISLGDWRKACAVYRTHFARGTSQMLDILEQTGLARK